MLTGRSGRLASPRSEDLPAWYTEEHTREALVAEQGRLAL